MKKELYISLDKTWYTDSKYIPLSGICTVYGASAIPMECVVFSMSGQALTISALDVISRIAPLYPDYTISNIGPTECNVFLNHPQTGKLAKLLKSAALFAIMFFGGAVAIMTFHEDVDMPSVHSDIYAFFTGRSLEHVPVVSIPYSIGIALGFVMLFGLYKRKKSSPTVLDIDIHNHENELRDYLSAKSKHPNG